MRIDDHDIYTRRSQEVIMVLFALRGLGAIHSKEEVLRFIREHHFYDIQPEDTESYESKREWKADTLLCFGRKDAVIGEWMFDHDEKDSWELTRDGGQALNEIISRFRNGRWKIHKCFLWRPEFKKIIDPSYIPSSRDHGRAPISGRRNAVERALELLLSLGRHGVKPP